MKMRLQGPLVPLVGIAAIVGALLFETDQAGAKELKLASPFSPKHLMQRVVFSSWAKEVARRTDNDLTIRLFGGGALGKGPVQQYKRAVDGVADIAFGLQGYTSSLFPRTLLVDLPGFEVENNVVMTNRLWDAMPLIRGEYKGTRLLAAWTIGPYVVMTKKRPVRSMEDLKGLKLRTTSRLLAKALQLWGATPLTMPITRVYNALQTGVIDGLLIGSSAIRSFKLGEQVRFYTESPPLYTSLFLAMNAATYEALSAGQKAAIDGTTGRALSLTAARAYDVETVKQLANELKSGRGQLIKLSDAEKQRWVDSVANLKARTIADLEAEGIPARKIVSILNGRK